MLLSVTPIDSDACMCSLELLPVNTYLVLSGTLWVKPAIYRHVIMVTEPEKASIFRWILCRLHFSSQAFGNLSQKAIIKDKFLFFLYDPLPRVLSASGVIMRLTKDYPYSGCLEKYSGASHENTFQNNAYITKVNRFLKDGNGLSAAGMGLQGKKITASEVSSIAFRIDLQKPPFVRSFFTTRYCVI